jgi:hypothetical protein
VEWLAIFDGLTVLHEGLVILLATSASISFISFMASTMHNTLTTRSSRYLTRGEGAGRRRCRPAKFD